MPQWAKIIPLDNELLKVEKLSIFIEQNKNTVNIDSGYSLCGVHCKTWAHFIVQYLPKLYLLEKLQSIVEYPLTLIIPQYNDRQIYEIVYSSLAKFRNLKIINADYFVWRFANTAASSQYIDIRYPVNEIQICQVDTLPPSFTLTGVY